MTEDPKPTAPAARLSSRGKTGQAMRKAVRSARISGKLDGSAGVLAVLAEDAADLVDLGRKSGDARLMLAAGRQVRDLLGRLPLDVEAPAPAAGSDPLEDAIGGAPE